MRERLARDELPEAAVSKGSHERPSARRSPLKVHSLEAAPEEIVETGNAPHCQLTIDEAHAPVPNSRKAMSTRLKLKTRW